MRGGHGLRYIQTSLLNEWLTVELQHFVVAFSKNLLRDNFICKSDIKQSNVSENGFGSVLNFSRNFQSLNLV